ncbi:MAG: c-type cytochrome [Williamsia sp.]|nr:c-type cytochrome [Williamsia sp.]
MLSNYRICLPFFCLLVLAGCQSNNQSATDRKADSVAIRQAVASTPVLSAQDAIQKMQLEDGFDIKVVAAEPLVKAPVVMTFDARGRMWVLEMEGYMTDSTGSEEGKPLSKIVILEDTNRDGVADTRKLFMDSLKLARAICLIEDGILIGEPTNLWFVTINNDRPVKKTLIDSAYTEGGNVEHQSNGLVRALDNWIYNAESGKKYKRNGNGWIVASMRSKGQWGMSQDDYGRLYYNNNSQNLLGDFFPPHFGSNNKNQRRVAGMDEKIVADNRVYPARPTPGVNRGYMDGVLDDSVRLTNFTAASGPVLYRGDLFPKEYYLNAFVGEPSANLIKRNILELSGYQVKGKQAYAHREFLTSTDERFRPVTLYNGPDGALYVLDMYRGVIQHKTYQSDYLKKEIDSRKLYKPLECGRIYKIVPKGTKEKFVSMPADPQQLVALLHNRNGWIRDKAQQLLVDGKYTQIVPGLRRNLQSPDTVAAIYSLWILEGLHALQPEDVFGLLQQKPGALRLQALSVLPSVMNKSNVGMFAKVLENVVQEHDTLAAPYIAFLAQSVKQVDSPMAEQLLWSVLKSNPRNTYVSDAVISNLQGREAQFLKQVAAYNPDTSLVINKRLRRVLSDISDSKNRGNAKLLEKMYPKGVAAFKTICQTCHGSDGNGVRSLAPPLNRSDWVMGDKNRLIPILLYGLSGPVMVNGTMYQPPDYNADMPAIGNNKELSDEDIAQLLSYIRNSWSNQGSKITAADVSATRKKWEGRQKVFTMDELKKIKPEP